MGTYVQNNLTKDEKVIKEAKRTMAVPKGSWVAAALYLAGTIIIILSAILLQPDAEDIMSYIFYAIIGLAFVALNATRALTYKKTELAFTNKRLIGCTGWFKAKPIDVELNKISDVLVYQDLSGKIFKYSSIKVTTKKDKDSEYVINYVKDAEAFKKALLEQAKKLTEVNA